MSQILIAYYSRKGENYVNGNIVDLKEGNTSIIAKYIQKYTGGDLFEIETQKDYSKDYHQCTLEAKEELQSNLLPLLKRDLDNKDDYQIIFIGYPNWWGTYPRVILSFLKTMSLKKKIIIPFCTHEGSGMGQSREDLKKECNEATIHQGISIKGSLVKNSEEKIKDWLESIKEEWQIWQ